MENDPNLTNIYYFPGVKPTERKPLTQSQSDKIAALRESLKQETQQLDIVLNVEPDVTPAVYLFMRRGAPDTSIE